MQISHLHYKEMDVKQCMNEVLRNTQMKKWVMYVGERSEWQEVTKQKLCSIYDITVEVHDKSKSNF